MRTYTQLFWNLLLFLFVVCLLWFSWEAYTLHTKVSELEEHTIQVGEDKHLRNTVDKLETSLMERSQIVFASSIDPLELSRVIISKNIMLDQTSFMAALETKPRLSCIIDGPNRRAIIRLKNKNHVVGAGDRFEGFQVVSIDADRVTLSRNGRTLPLTVQAASKDLARQLSEMDFDF